MQEFGSLEDAPAWIRQDNFTVLESLHPKSESAPRSVEQVKISENDQKKKGGKPVSLLKEVSNGFLPAGNALATDHPFGTKVDQQEKNSSPQKGRLDRQEVRSHRRERLLSNSAKNTQDSGAEVSEVRSSTAQVVLDNTHNCISHSVANKMARSLLDQTEHLSPTIPKVLHVQKSYAKSRTEDHSLKKRRQLNGFASHVHKKEKVSEPEVTKDILLEARTLIPNGCCDLATSDGSYHVGGNSNAEFKGVNTPEKMGKSQAHDEMFQTEVFTKQSAERKELAHGNLISIEKPVAYVHLDRREHIPSVLSRNKSKDINCLMRRAETYKVEAFSSSCEYKASCSTLPKSVAENFDSEGLFLEQLQDSLKEGNCQSALEALKAWKIKRQQVGTRQIEDGFSQGEGHEMGADVPGRTKGFVVSYDISRGLEKLLISCVNECNTDVLPENFLYVKKSVIRQAAHVDISFSRIGDLHCCCADDCLRSSEACKCTDSTRGQYAYDENGRLIERLAIGYVSGCTTINGDFITECCDKCRCSMKCGNRIVQRGITRKLQVFMTRKKGWGVRALEKIPARTFVFEYLGEIATNSEQYERNLEYKANGVYTYTMCLDADLDMENKHFKDGLTDQEALVLDATIFGNVSRFVNHRCNDANLFMRPVQIETRDTHYYHAAFFAARDIEEMEELTWDYGIDFEDDTHLLKAFKCYCKSSLCRDKMGLLKQDKGRKVKLIKSNQ
ncbi:hypothetical protein GOP47_0008619 [Adiantum capillus-veneris]|uniref:Uncharacterized protein n=1 Tax=Adiantum capillus-veneris TaxID=13818 RepID=A0A9D4ZIC7_ADICA|nr:hypothetical protein GOP47_0008619 [Adiantum capillus-veneris]